MIAETSSDLGKEICKIFNLNPNKIIGFSIIVNAESIVELRTVQFVQVAESKKIIQLIKDYKIVPKEPKDKGNGSNSNTGK